MTRAHPHLSSPPGCAPQDDLARNPGGSDARDAEAGSPSRAFDWFRGATVRHAGLDSDSSGHLARGAIAARRTAVRTRAQALVLGEVATR